MIDDKKIAEAARYYCNNRYSASPDAPFIAEGFRQGAKWAINKSLKDLWHPASEEPNIKQGECCVTCLVKFKNGRRVCDDMSPKNFKRNFKGWLYIDDLLPKEGGEK